MSGFRKKEKPFRLTAFDSRCAALENPGGSPLKKVAAESSGATS